MKRSLIYTFLACGAGLLLATAAQAETPTPTPTPGDGGHPHDGGLLGRLAWQLDLTGSQQAEIAPILEAAKPQLKQIHEQAKQQVDTLLNNVGGQIAPLLTGSQQAQLSQVLQNIENGPGPGGRHFGRGRFGGPGGHGGPGGPGGGGAGQLERLTAALGLSAQQQAEIKPILEAAHTQVQAIFTNSSLTQDQKFAQVKETMDAAQSQINGDLSPQQQTEFAALKGKFHKRWHGGPDASPSPSPTATPGT